MPKSRRIADIVLDEESVARRSPEVEHERAVAQLIGRRAAAAPFDSVHAGEQLVQIEGLDQVVVGPGVDDAVWVPTVFTKAFIRSGPNFSRFTLSM